MKHVIRCPRCGYDLRGMIEAWTDSCQISGRCAECGLRFEWGEFLSTMRKKPTWHVEYAFLKRRVPWAMCCTGVLSFIPWMFWSKLRMSHFVRWKRMLVYLIALVFIGFLMFGTFNALQAGKAWREYSTYAANNSTRLAALGSAGLFKPKPSLAVVVSRAFAWPLGYRVLFTYQMPGSGSQVWTAGYRMQTWFARLFKFERDVALFLMWFILMLPTAFILLPTSRKAAKVRWAHIGRIFAYSLLFPAIFIYTLISFAGMDMLRKFGSTRPLAFYINAPRLMVAGIFVMLSIWWWCAIHKYLRMDDAWKVSASVIATAFMVSMVSTYLVYTEFISSLISRFIFPFGV